MVQVDTRLMGGPTQTHRPIHGDGLWQNQLTPSSTRHLTREESYSYSYGLPVMEFSKSTGTYQLPLLVLPHLRPLGTSVGGKLLGTGASCIVTASYSYGLMEL